MYKLISRAGFVLIMLIVMGVATCSVQKRLLTADPSTAPALAKSRLDAKPALDALDQFHTVHGYYPHSSDELDARVWPMGFVYQVNSLGRVYESLDCAARSKDFTGINKDPGSYYQRLGAFLRECVRGYSNFELKSAAIRTAWSVNHNVLAFADFQSMNGTWKLDWCRTPEHATSYDCRKPMNDESDLYLAGAKLTAKATPRGSR